MAETMHDEMDQSYSSSETPQQQKQLEGTSKTVDRTFSLYDLSKATPAPVSYMFDEPIIVHEEQQHHDDLIAQEGKPTGHTVRDFSPPPAIRPQHMDDDVKVDVITMIRDIGDGDELQGICISKVVHTLRDIEPDVYTPKFVSIGPFHHCNGRLQGMERCKQVLFKRFIQRSGMDLDVLISFIKSSVPKVRASYSENINLSDRDLVKLILVDAAFIIELFFSLHHDSGMEILTEDPKLSQLAILGTLPLDLVLFENQLPFFVLKELFDIAFPHDLDDNVSTFAKLACEFFCAAFNLEMPKHEPDNYTSVKHFTDLIRFLLLQRAPPPPPIKMEPYLWNTGRLLYSAKKLQEFGVKFKLSKSKSILDINFSGHVLQLPDILVVDLVTDALFRNMIAFEQLHCSFTSYITNYVTLWSSLINTEEDVHLLVDKKVIHSFMHDAEVVTLFRSMGRSSFEARMIQEYIVIFQRLNEFCTNSCRQNIASLRRDYCRTRWQTVASFAGILILILTLLQTIFSILE